MNVEDRAREQWRDILNSIVGVTLGLGSMMVFVQQQGGLEALLQNLDTLVDGIAKAMAGLDGPQRLDAALRFVVDFQDSYSLGSIVDIEPEHVLSQMKRVIPIMHERIARVIPGDNADVAAAAVVRIAVCHYLVQGGTPEQFLAELRLAAGLDPGSRRSRRDTRRNGRTGEKVRDGRARTSVS